MIGRPTFESRLSAALGVYAEGAPTDVDPIAMTTLVSTTTGARGRGLPNLIAGRRSSAILLVGLAILAVAAAVIGASRLEPRRELFGSFSPTGDLPPSTRGSRYLITASSLLDGRVLVTGMYDSSDLGDTWSYLYEPATGTWVETGREAQVRQLSSATTLRDGRVLIVGGWHVDEEGTVVAPAAGDLYDPATGTFTPTKGGLATPRYGHTATLLDDGRVLIAGGGGADFNAPNPNVASAEIYDPATGTFTTVGPMASARAYHLAARLPDGRVLVTGGITSRTESSTASAEIFDPATDTFTPTGSMTVDRTWHAGAVLPDGRVLIVGGGSANDAGDSWAPLAAAELYDPARGTFESAGALATERTQPAITVLPDGDVLVVGGTNDDGSPRMAELFDVATGRFLLAGESTAPHSEAWAGGLPDGRVLVLGLAQDAMSGGVPELWSASERPTTVSVPPASGGPGFLAADASPPLLRSSHTATRLEDGRVLIAGGRDSARGGRLEALATAVLLDPATGRSTPVGDMAVPRVGHVAVPLLDGRVMVLGGETADCSSPDGNCSWPTPTAEVFDPTNGTFTGLAADLGPAPNTYRASDPAAILLDDGRVLYVPGAGSARASIVVDPKTGVGLMTERVRCMAGVSLARLADGRIFVQCGNGSDGAFIFDPAGMALTQVSATESWDAAVTLADGRVLVLAETGEAAIFDPATETYTSTGSFDGGVEEDRYGRGADSSSRRVTLLDDGRVLVSGGRTLGLGEPSSLATARLYDPSSGTFQEIGPMLAARFQHTATALEDGRVLLVGGVRRSPDRTDPEPASVEIFDPAAVP